MREIKFRAWDKKNKEFITQLHSIDFLFKSIHGGFPFFGSMDYPFEMVEIMQYTGLKDKNGVEIYEGDIVKKENIGRDSIEEVIIDISYGIMQCLPFNPELSGSKDWEVIGNVHENPELLEV